jgi:hypothetical protein
VHKLLTHMEAKAYGIIIEVSDQFTISKVSYKPLQLKVYSIYFIFIFTFINYVIN